MQSRNEPTKGGGFARKREGGRTQTKSRFGVRERFEHQDNEKKRRKGKTKKGGGTTPRVGKTTDPAILGTKERGKKGEAVKGTENRKGGGLYFQRRPGQSAREGER